MTDIIYGLNVSRNLSEIVDPVKSFSNIGMSVRDIDVFRSLPSEGLTRTDFRLLSSLDTDIKRELTSLAENLQNAKKVVSDGILNTDVIPFDLIISDNILAASSIKYNYYSFRDQTIKVIDVSTSKTSVFSKIEQGPTGVPASFYGSNLNIIPNPVTQQSDIIVSQLNFEEIRPRVYNSEIPTHTITLNINGSPKQFYAIKNVPFSFRLSVSDFNLLYDVDSIPSNPAILPSLELVTLDSSENEVSKIVYADMPKRLSINAFDFTTRERRMDFFWPPSLVTELDLGRIGLISFPEIRFDALERLSIDRNDRLSNIPDFRGLNLAPNLQFINLEFLPNLKRGGSANQILNKLPLSLITLNVSNTFSGTEENIDLSDYTNLRTLQMTSNVSGIYSERTPKVSGAIINYYVTKNSFNYLDSSVCEAPNLENLSIETLYSSTRPTSRYGISGQINDLDEISPITIASENITRIVTERNSHNMINVSGKETLEYYSYFVCLQDPSINDGFLGNTLEESSIEGIFTGCTNLKTIKLESVSCTGSITNAFSGLTSLSYLSIKNTSVNGYIGANTFATCPNLNTLLISPPTILANSPLANFPNFRLGYDPVSEEEVDFFHPDCFSQNSLLQNIEIRDTFITSTNTISSATIIGDFPSLRASSQSLESLFLTYCKRITSMFQSNNGFSGFSNLLVISVVESDLSQDVFPEMSNPTLSRLSIRFTNLPGEIPDLILPSLGTFVIENNPFITGPIPNVFSFSIGEFNVSGNDFTSYKKGTISSYVSLRVFDASSNNLNLSDAISILEDCIENYNQNERSGVVIDISNNNFTLNDILAVESAEISLSFLSTIGWTVRIQ